MASILIGPRQIETLFIAAGDVGLKMVIFKKISVNKRDLGVLRRHKTLNEKRTNPSKKCLA